jgi:hypothetical protein
LKETDWLVLGETAAILVQLVKVISVVLFCIGQQMSVPSNNPNRKRRWFRLTPDRCLIGLLGLEGFLLLSERFHWFAFNDRKGWTLLIAVATVALAGVLMSLWFAGSLLFRRRFQFSVRSLLVLVVVVAVPCSRLAIAMEQAEGQRRAIEEIGKLGGGVWCDYEIDALDNPMQGAEPPAPKWLRNLLGDEFFANATTVSFLRMGDFSGLVIFGGDRITDGGLVHLKALNQLKTLQLYSSKVTDAGLVILKDLPQLVSLDMKGDKITDPGLVYIAGLARLRSLELRGINLTDAGLTNLKGLSALSLLDLRGTHVTDAGLDRLKGLTDLAELFLEDTNVTDEGVKSLQLAVPKCQITR